MIKKLENLYIKYLNNYSVDLYKDDIVGTKCTLISSEVYKMIVPIDNEDGDVGDDEVFENLFTGRQVDYWDIDVLGGIISRGNTVWKKTAANLGQFSEEVVVNFNADKEVVYLIYKVSDRYFTMNTGFYKKTWWLLKND